MRICLAVLVFLVTFGIAPLVNGATSSDNAILFYWYSKHPPFTFVGPEGEEDINLNRGSLYKLTYLRLFDRLGVEAGLSSLSSLTKPTYDLASGVTVDYRIKYTDVRIPVTVKYVFHPGNFDFYGGLGTGLYWAKLEESVVTSEGYARAVSGTSVGPEFRIVFGGDYRFSDHFAIGLDIERSWCRYNFGEEGLGGSRTVRSGNPSVFIQYLF